MYPVLHEVNCELHLRIPDTSFVQQIPSKNTHQRCHKSLQDNYYKLISKLCSFRKYPYPPPLLHPSGILISFIHFYKPFSLTEPLPPPGNSNIFCRGVTIYFLEPCNDPDQWYTEYSSGQRYNFRCFESISKEIQEKSAPSNSRKK